MSAAFADFDHDGRLDIFITNDAVPNFLFRNNGDGTFAETALLAGVSVPDTGRPSSSMGVDAQDYDNDGWEDIHFTALTGETFPLFRNESATNRGTFVEVTQPSGLAALTVKSSGWCSIVADFDNDGWKDIFTANSHVNDRIGDFEALEFRQPNSLFLNDRHGRFRDATVVSRARDRPGRAPRLRRRRLQRRRPSRHRGARRSARPRSCGRTTAPRTARWLIVRLAGTKSNRDGIGARVIVGNQVRTMTTAMGYASSSHAGLHFGSGAATAVPRVEVRWPSGATQVVENVKANQVLEIRER